ncbi:Nif11 family protein [Prochlorococcus marinus]|uniref:Nitrogen fixation protein n=1 Tax=Prochlorococcus marinus XMU1408 TaxID=2213228 RepID=A0A318R2W3_PROMR|nr:Nif11 family protein [Prochlorococcus marinus]MBW3042024.1 nitrogen fixation protein [Prochlorococcus marinus str. XMU1408]PYE03145.1 nitrogen fixation protein [Prochlorococcus marinus XMU1408]
MTKKDFERFLLKIENLNKLVDLIKASPEKYELFIKCKSHQEVVDLASQWGFDIGKRWGES